MWRSRPRLRDGGKNTGEGACATSTKRRRMVGPGRLGLPASALSGLRSSQLSYGPEWHVGSSNPDCAGIQPDANSDEARRELG